MSARKIAFIKSGSFSHINESVATQLRKNFPEFELITLDVREILRASKSVIARGLLQAAKLHGFKVRRDPLDCLIQTPLAFNFIKRRIAEIVRPNDFVFTLQTQSMWDASVLGMPHFIYTDHTELANKQYRDFDPRELKGRWWNKLENEIYANASMIFTMSSHVTNSLIEDYGCSSEKVQRIGAGGNAPVSEASVFDAERYRRKEILFVGTEWERKGGRQLAEAFRKVLSSHPDARLKIVGCSPQLNLVNCEVLGLVPLEEVSRCYERASLFCLPTRKEPFGVVFIEAMLAGLPIVATDVGAVPDLVENGRNGQRVPLDDVDVLASTLIQLLSNPEQLERMGKISRQEAQQNHTWDHVGQRMKFAIETALERDTKELATACAS